MDITSHPAWRRLADHRDALADTRIESLFELEPDRASRLTITGGGITLDYSKNLASAETMSLLGRLADAVDLAGQVRAMFDGAIVNPTEGRAALHTLLRNPDSTHPAASEVRSTLAAMQRISDALRSGAWRGTNGDPIRHVVHIGIGGSYLGPRMVDEALRSHREPDIACHYLANVDGHHVTRLLERLRPEETLIIVASKSFTTIETRTNADTCRRWLLSAMTEVGLPKHLVGVTTNLDAAATYGIDAVNVLPMWDFVGGRYSLWSAVGLPVAIGYGFEVFEQLLDGARAMDEHFRDAPFDQNIPALMGLLSVWYNNFHDIQSHAILPYDHFLRLLPAHLQQLEMESNGKQVAADGEALNLATGPVIWGGEGTNGQHAFHQLLHQGTRTVTTDFILPLKAHHPERVHHDQLVANCLSQARALMVGRDADTITAELEAGGMDSAVAQALARHKAMPGNRPSNTLIVDQVNAASIGALVALYEHRVFCQAAVWQSNPFDQWGVELGKEIGNAIYQRLESGASGSTNSPSFDPSTEHLIHLYLNSQE